MKKLSTQKRLAAGILKTSKSKIRLDTAELEDIKEAITKIDIKSLIKKGSITKIRAQNTSRVRARKLRKQKSKGRQQGKGSREGKRTARLPRKVSWMNHLRLQRAFLQEMKTKSMITNQMYRALYAKSKGGFFRSKRHLKLYMQENKMFKNEKS